MPDDAINGHPAAQPAKPWRVETGWGDGDRVTDGTREFNAHPQDAAWLADRLNAIGVFACAHNVFDRADALQVEDVEGNVIRTGPDQPQQTVTLAPMSLARFAMVSCLVKSRPGAPTPIQIRYDRNGVLQVSIHDAVITNAGATARPQDVWSAVLSAARSAIADAPVPVDRDQLANLIAERAVPAILGAVRVGGL